MRKNPDGTFTLSATDLSIYLSCGHAIRLEKELKDGKRSQAELIHRDVFAVRQLGNEHERRFIDHLISEGHKVYEFASSPGHPGKHATTLEAMQQGYDYIVQAEFQNLKWFGRADILKKVTKPSKLLGDWSYEVMDTKLSQETKGGMILQLSVYSDLLNELQGEMPDSMHIVKPGQPFAYDEFRCEEYFAYYRWIKRRLVLALENMDSTGSYPEPVTYCDTCKWLSVCDRQRRDDDHLSFVAGLQSTHDQELKRQNLNTLTKFANADQIQRPSKGSIQTLERLQLQAKIQNAQKTAETPLYEFLLFSPGEGLSRLPDPDPGDVFFDIEGDRFYKDGSIEYLLGLAFIEDGSLQYKGIWSTDRHEEKSAFNEVMTFLIERQKVFPGMHIYHYNHYEPDAVKHLMLRHSIWAEELDRFLRGERFVDLYTVLRQSLRAGVESYGLKKLEPHFKYVRECKLETAIVALRHIQRALELDLPTEIQQGDQDIVEAYNRDDCFSTKALRDWLEELRTEQIQKGIEILRPQLKPDKPNDKATARELKIKAVLDPLLQKLPTDSSEWEDQHRQVRLLTDLLDYFRREDKNFWWEYFRIKKLEHDDLLAERKAITGLSLVEKFPPRGRDKNPIHRFSFPSQEFSGSKPNKLELISTDTERISIGTIDALDHTQFTIDIKRSGETQNLTIAALQIYDLVDTEVIEDALLRFALNISEDGITGTGKYQAGRDLLFRNLPKLNSGKQLTDYIRSVDVLADAIEICQDLHSSVLPIQGPPGTGKTFTAAHMICSLYKAGKRIGVSAVGHKAISNLLKRLQTEANRMGLRVLLAQKDKKSEDSISGVEYIESKAVSDYLDQRYVVGAPVFTWSREDLEEKLDYLFVDEAGQMALASALAISGSTQNLILLGDPQQLDQPQKAAHPGGADISALQHYIGLQHQTIEPIRGLFIDTTRRLHPSISQFTSKLYYEGKLKSLPGLESQVITSNPFFGKHQLVYIPVEHSGNTNFSQEEIDAIADILSKLIHPGTQWIDGADSTTARPLTTEDIMVVAPYNAQVSALKRRFPEMASGIGTVDKFQGRERAVVIYSMTSSSIEDAPRGMSFLFQPNRLNVASSRAKCLFILVASPKLFEAECRTPEQMKMANGLCAFRDAADSY